MSINILQDLEGRIKTCQALLAKMPKGRVICLGDLVDRGLHSKDLVQFFIENKYESLWGNHEELLADYYNGIITNGYIPYLHDLYISANNGGKETLMSYGIDFNDVEKSVKSNRVLKEHIQWLSSRPRYLELNELILTHAPLEPSTVLAKGKILKPDSLNQMVEDKEAAWNRCEPQEIKGRIQIFGHESYKDVAFFSTQGMSSSFNNNVFAIGLDTSVGGVISGIHYPSMEIYQQEIID